MANSQIEFGFRVAFVEGEQTGEDRGKIKYLTKREHKRGFAGTPFSELRHSKDIAV